MWPPKVTRWTVGPSARENPAPASDDMPSPDPARVEWLIKAFVRERKRFGVLEARLALSETVVERRRFRDFAAAQPSNCTVWLHPAALEELDRDNLLAILRHELAHLLDPSRSEPDTDRLAEAVTGQPIRYDARLVQTVSRSKGVHRRRPASLPEWTGQKRDE